MDWPDWAAKIWAINPATVSLRTGRLIDHADFGGLVGAQHHAKTGDTTSSYRLTWRGVLKAK